MKRDTVNAGCLLANILHSSLCDGCQHQQRGASLTHNVRRRLNNLFVYENDQELEHSATDTSGTQGSLAST
jgi:hypothetical protein